MKTFKIDIYVWMDKYTMTEHIYTEDIQTLYLTFEEIKHHFRTGLHGFKPKTSKQAIRHLNLKNDRDAIDCRNDRRVLITIN